MKKNDLLGMKRLLATPAMVKAAKTDEEKVITKRYKDYLGHMQVSNYRSYKYSLYFRATAEHGILKVAVFTRKMLVLGKKEPQFEIFCDKADKKYMTYELKTGKWRSAKINMLDYDFGSYSYLYATENYQSADTRKLVNEYFSTEKNLDVKAAVLGFQADICGEKLQKKHKNELEQIDETMSQVPEIPKDFDSWVIKNCFKETLFYERDRPCRWPKMLCTHCGKWEDAPQMPEHGKEAVCPSCGAKATYRSWNKQKCVVEEAQVVLLQKLMDCTGYILRKFDCRLKRRNENGWENAELSKHETIRARLDMFFGETELFEYGEYKYTGVTRWCHECRRSGFGYYYHFGRGIMYTKNLRQVLRDRDFVKANLKDIFKGGEKEYVDPEYLLQRLEQYPFIEYLEKSGLTNLVEEIMEAKEDSVLFDKSAKRIHEALKLDKQHFTRLKEVNGASKVLKALQYEIRTGSKVTDDNIRYIADNNIDIAELEMHRTNMSLQKTLNFLRRQQELHGYDFREMRRYFEDYLDMAEVRGMDLTDEIVCRNPRIMEFHNRYLEEKNKDDNTARDKAVNEKYRGIRRDYEQNKEHFQFETNEYLIMVPRSASDITKEGRRQHHCVGASDGYISRMNARSRFIVFLRKKSERDIPYYTIEVDWNGKVYQFYAAYDRQPDKEKIKALLDEWSALVNERTEEQKRMDCAI